MKNFKVGDECYFDFKKCTITEMEGSFITRISDGYISTCGHDLIDECFPINDDIEKLSDAVAYWQNRFSSLRTNSLNHPELKKYLINIWVDMCNNPKDKAFLTDKFIEMDEFGKAVCNKVDEINEFELNGIKIFR